MSKNNMQLLRAPRNFKTREKKLLWKRTCVGLHELGLLAGTSRVQIRAHVNAIVKMRDTIRKPRGSTPYEQLRAIEEVGRSAARIYAPNMIRRTKGGIVFEIQRSLHLRRSANVPNGGRDDIEQA